jgi:isopenicillin N synthase-like dioxygenase
MAAGSIPVIEASRLSGSTAERRACAREIGAACEGIGFFQVVGHGIEPALLERTFDLAAEFFAQPLASKMALALDKESGYRGYFPVKGEVTDPAAGADPKEGFDIAFRGDRDSARDGNRWPPAMPEVKPVLTAYYDALSGLARDLSRGFALALELPEDFFEAKLDRPTTILRVLHYPPVERVADPAALPPQGCGAHSDYGYLTILAQDSQGGLQVQQRDGTWVEVPPLEGAFVCNIGEMMARWTNDRFRATPHRVIRVRPESRYSIPFFFHPNPDVLIETLPSCLAACGTQTYPPITSGEYLERRLGGAYR